MVTKFSDSQRDCAKRIKTIKDPLEANLIFSIYKQPELLLSYEMTENDFINKPYKYLFRIASSMVLKEKTQDLNEVSVGMYLEGHPDLKGSYEEFGGWDVIQMGFEYNTGINFESDYDKNIKYNILLNLLSLGYPVDSKLEVKDEQGQSWIDKDIQTIYEEIDAEFNRAFLKITNALQIEDISDNGEGLIEKWDSGLLTGIPFKNFPLLTNFTGGMLEGAVIMIGASSNTGKSGFVRNEIIPSLLDQDEPSLTILNEETREKWLREELVQIINNEFKYPLNKNVLKYGGFKPEVKEKLYLALEWLKEKKDKKLLNFISFPQYINLQALKVVRQSANNGVKNIIIDTFKCDNDRISKRAQAWEMFKQNMVDLSNVARDRKVCIVTTVQLGSASDKVRYLTRQDLAESKGIIESVATAIFMRRIWDDEYTGEKNALEVYKYNESGNKELVKLDKSKNYLVLFIDKSRDGAAKESQVIAEVDWAHNTIKEIGFTKIPFSGNM